MNIFVIACRGNCFFFCSLGCVLFASWFSVLSFLCCYENIAFQLQCKATMLRQRLTNTKKRHQMVCDGRLCLCKYAAAIHNALLNAVWDTRCDNSIKNQPDNTDTGPNTHIHYAFAASIQFNECSSHSIYLFSSSLLSMHTVATTQNALNATSSCFFCQTNQKIPYRRWF